MSMTLLEVRVQHLVVVSVAPRIPVPSSYVATKNESRDNQTRRHEGNTASFLCPFDFEKLHSMLSPPSTP